MAQILVVDDSATVRNEVSSFFKGKGYDVATANDGKQGLDNIKTDASIKLVFCDVNMPIMDGLTMVEKVRNELKNSKTAIIMLTTESDPKMKARGKASGVKGWIVKPFNGTSVLGAVKKLIG
ncbi:MAG: response regulator [Methylococcales bacterium]|jgi:two-component system, chemotaxis family, chemotaxis protein CheY|nr:response regulator [Methylococcales bacterium]MBT7409187.1 response regulator [Methylococcales bacterium]